MKCSEHNDIKRELFLNILSVPIRLFIEGNTTYLEILHMYRDYIASPQEEFSWNIEAKEHQNTLDVIVNCRAVKIDKTHGWPGLDDLIDLTVISTRTDIVFLHAASLTKNDAVLMLVGPSTSGKTTLATALQKHGYSLYADDVTPVELESLQALPYLKHGRNKAIYQNGSAQADHGKSEAKRQTACFHGRKIAHIFCLVPANDNCLRLPIGANMTTWREMHGACQRSAVDLPRGDCFVEIRREDAFKCKPSVTPCTAADALRCLLKHTRVPSQEFKILFSRIGRLVNSTTTYKVAPGYLDDTVADIINTVEMNHAHN